MSVKQKQAATPDRPITIGVLMDSMTSSYQVSLWRGIQQAAKTHNINLLCFLGNAINSSLGFQQQANVIYNLINANNVDGLIVATGTINHFIDQETLIRYLQKFRPLPVVSIAVEIENRPSILLDNAQGIRELVTHLIEQHNYRQIGFICMRAGHPEGDTRFQAYKDTLEAHGVPYDPDIVVPGEYYNQPEAAVSLLYDERQVAPEAIVAVNDYTALPFIQALSDRGISVPQDVAVVGFDGIEETLYSTPPLTTSRQPLCEQAHQAVDLILKAIQGHTVPLKFNFAPKLIVRESCGCNPADRLSAMTSPPTLAAAPAERLRNDQAQILSSLLTVAETLAAGTIQALLEALILALENNQPEVFQEALNHTLAQPDQEDMPAWRAVLSTLQQYLSGNLPDTPQRHIVENLIQQARVMIADSILQHQAKQRLKTQRQHTAFRNLSQAINAAGNYPGIIAALSRELPALGISEYSLALYDKGDPSAATYTLVLARTATGDAALPLAGLAYPAQQLLPEGFLPQARRFTKMVTPLYFQEDQFGFVTLEADAADDTMYDGLARQISGGLKGSTVIQQARRHALQLQTASAISRAASSILDPAELAQKAVVLVKERFDLYYAGIFLVDEKKQWAELRAGTGQAGKNMLAEKWRLEVGGGSMIGQCVVTGEADIQLNIAEAPVHLRNPHLPDTQSELALPLFSRGEILGALTIQSQAEDAFNTADIAIFQTMADQLANAIKNADLYAALAQEQYLMRALMNNTPEAIFFKDRESRFVRTSRYMTSNFGVKEPQDIIGKTDFDFFTKDHARPAYEDEQRIIETREPLVNIEERETWEDRPDTWVLTSKMPLYDENNEIVGTFGISRDITERKKAEIALEHQSNQLQTTIEVSRAISEMLDPSEINQRVVDLIQKHFGLYYVGLFIVDEHREFAVLQAGTGEAGENMLAEKWKLALDSGSMIGRCVEEAKADIQLDVNTAPAHLRNPHLPATKSEMALPLFSRGAVLGALTIQSDQANAFNPDDASVLQTMANQVATSIANAQLFEQTQLALMDTETLLNVAQLASRTLDLETSLQEILDLVLKATDIEAGLFSIANLETNRLEITAEQLPIPFMEMIQMKGLDGSLCDLVYQQGESILLSDLDEETPVDTTGLQQMGFNSYQGVPLEVRGKVLGTLCTFSSRRLRPEDSRMSLLHAVGQQVGVTIENARLLEQTQDALSQTARLFSGSEKIAKAESIRTVLNALVSSSMLESMERVGMVLFNQPWREEQAVLPDALIVVANWTQPGIEIRTPIGTNFAFSEYPVARFFTSKEPIFLQDIPSNPQVDQNSRHYLVDILRARSATVLPLLVGNEVIGGIIAFSSESIELEEDEIRQIVSLTDQASIAVQNIRLFEQAQATLAELEATQRRYQLQSWRTYNQNRVSSGYQKTAANLEPLGRQKLAEVEQVIQEQAPIISEEDEQLKLTVPIMLRDQPIGAIGLQAGPDQRRWTTDEIALIQEIGEQFALAAESLRLLDETQRRAARERLVAEITTKIRASNDPQAMIETAAQELREALQAQRAQVIIQQEETPPIRGEE